MNFKQQTQKFRTDERGNVLFLILIAVALFAALSYAVTQSTRSGGGTGDNETSLISSAQLTQYPASVRTAVVRMIIGGTNIEDLEFNTPTDFEDCFGHANNKQAFCVFHPNGGGATYTQAPVDMMSAGTAGTWVFNAENQIGLLGVTNTTATDEASAELIAFLPGITRTLCARINSELNITGIPALSGIDIATQMINDDATVGGRTGICDGGCGGTIGGALEGHPFGCFENSDATDTEYVYYHVLVER